MMIHNVVAVRSPLSSLHTAAEFAGGIATTRIAPARNAAMTGPGVHTLPGSSNAPSAIIGMIQLPRTPPPTSSVR